MVDILLDVGESDNPIPLPNVSSNVLKKVRFFHLLLLRYQKNVFFFYILLLNEKQRNYYPLLFLRFDCIQLC